MAAASSRSDSAAKGAAYLTGRQQSNGAFFSSDHPADAVAEVVTALAAAGRGGEPMTRALGYLASAGPARATKAAYAGRIVLGLVAAGRDPSSFGGFDYPGRIESFADNATGSYDRESLYGNSLALLGLSSGGRPVPAAAVRFVRDNQCASGGWSHRRMCAAPPDADTTAVTMVALLSAGVARTDEAVAGARSYLVRTQNPSGGWGLEVGKPTNSNSTALVMSAVATLGEDATAGDWRHPDGSDGLKALLSLQHPSGGFRYLAGEGPNDYATVQSVTGVSGLALPVRGASPVPDDRPPPAAPPSGSRDGSASAAPRPGNGAVQIDGSPSPAGGRNRAGLVIRDPDGRLRRMCLVFEEPQISGLDLISRLEPDLVVEAGQLGSAICRIGPHGCPKSDGCFCRYPAFWGYWTKEPSSGKWSFSESGASARVIRDGSVDAWTWGRDGGPAPSETTIDQVCAAGPQATGPAGARAAKSTGPAGARAAKSKDGTATSAKAPLGLALALAAAGGALGLRRLRLRPGGDQH